uniref:Uncharacterized protein n=1 Tax=Steinernema glaseri TaxID=37863 RepID=A0A1I8APX4_9BILA
MLIVQEKICQNTTFLPLLDIFAVFWPLSHRSPPSLRPFVSELIIRIKALAQSGVNPLLPTALGGEFPSGLSRPTSIRSRVPIDRRRLINQAGSGPAFSACSREPLYNGAPLVASRLLLVFCCCGPGQTPRQEDGGAITVRIPEGALFWCHLAFDTSGIMAAWMRVRLF